MDGEWRRCWRCWGCRCHWEVSYTGLNQEAPLDGCNPAATPLTPWESPIKIDKIRKLTSRLTGVTAMDFDLKFIMVSPACDLRWKQSGRARALLRGLEYKHNKFSSGF